MRRLALLALVVVAAGAAITAGGDAARAGEARLPPDLVQVAPREVELVQRGDRRLLTFAAAAENRGRGPLVIKGARPDRSEKTMVATQVVSRADRSVERVGVVGRLRYVRSSDHSHWHLRDFMRFELRTEDGAKLGRDQKTGFCLGDRYDSVASTPAEPGRAMYTSRCGLGRPGLLRLTQGISVGYGDVYPANLEGQFIDVTGLRRGRYTLVHRVNPHGRLLDRRSGNDVSSVALRIGAERARVLRRCTGAARCPPG
jgi:hypothetical protein